MLTPALSRAARALLNWTQTDLARSAKVGLSTVRDFEGARRTPIANNLSAMQAALEAAGILFIPSNGAGAGVRAAKPEGQNGTSST